MPRTALLLAFLCAVGVFGVPDEGYALAPRVLLYHRVGDDRYPSTNVTTAAFRAQMAWLRDNGYVIVPTLELERYLQAGETIAERAVAIHFDDGYQSVYENAFPILREFGYPFTVFLPAAAVDKGFGDYFSWDTAKEMAADGASYGAHGVDHLPLGAPEPGEDGAGYQGRVAREMEGGARGLVRQGYEGRWVAYPYGEYNSDVLAAAQAAGFRLGFTQDPGAIGAGTDPFQIPRFAVVGTLADMATFRERMSYGALALAHRKPTPGQLPAGNPERYGATVTAPERYRPGVVNLFVSELGRLEAQFDPDTGAIEAYSPAPLARRLNRVLISVQERESGRYALASWVLIRPGGR